MTVLERVVLVLLLTGLLVGGWSVAGAYEEATVELRQLQGALDELDRAVERWSAAEARAHESQVKQLERLERLEAEER